MKKLILLCQVIVILLFLVRIAAVGGLMEKFWGTDVPLFSVNRAMATSPGGGNYRPPIRDVLEDDLQKERNLVASLKAKEADLARRENLLREEGQRLASLKREIIEKIDLLHSIEEKLNTTIKASETGEFKKYKSLAKVYEAMPPIKAGSMLEQLDIRTAAGITMNMKPERAGIIWGYISSAKAAEITREIIQLTKASPN